MTRPLPRTLAHLARRTGRLRPGRVAPGALLTVLAVLAVPAGLLAAAAPATAAVPQGWSDPEPVSLLNFLLVVAVVPIGLALLITLLTYLPSMLRGEGLAPGSGRGQDQWFGGPTRGTAELAAPDGEDSQSGGAGVRW